MSDRAGCRVGIAPRSGPAGRTRVHGRRLAWPTVVEPPGIFHYERTTASEQPGGSPAAGLFRHESVRVWLSIRPATGIAGHGAQFLPGTHDTSEMQVGQQF